MGYGMKYTKGGFPFKASPAKIDLTRKTNPGPIATVKKQDEEKFLNEKDHQSVPTFTNSNPSPNDQALANAKSKQMTKSSDLEKHDDDRAVSGGSNRKVMKDGAKNKAVYKGKPVKSDFTPHQFNKK